MPRVARKNKRESLLEEKRRLLEKLNAVDLQIEEADRIAKEKWDEAFLKGIKELPEKIFGEEYFSHMQADVILSVIEDALLKMNKKEEGEKEPSSETTDPEKEQAVPEENRLPAPDETADEEEESSAGEIPSYESASGQDLNPEEDSLSGGRYF